MESLDEIVLDLPKWWSMSIKGGGWCVLTRSDGVEVTQFTSMMIFGWRIQERMEWFEGVWDRFIVSEAPGEFPDLLPVLAQIDAKRPVAEVDSAVVEEMVLVPKRDLDCLLEACMKTGWGSDEGMLVSGCEAPTLGDAAAIILDFCDIIQEMRLEASQIADGLEQALHAMEAQGGAISSLVRSVEQEHCGLPVSRMSTSEIPLEGDWAVVRVSSLCLLPPGHDGECRDIMVKSRPVDE